MNNTNVTAINTTTYKKVIVGRKTFLTIDTLIAALSRVAGEGIVTLTEAIKYINSTAGGLVNSIKEEHDAVECGYFTTFRYDPRRLEKGEPALQLDCAEPDFSKLREFIMHETRFSMLPVLTPEHAEELLTKCEKYAKQRYEDIKKFGL